MRCNDITNRGVEFIVGGLKDNRTLGSLNAEGCQIGDEGASLFVALLAQNATIFELILRRNRFTAAGKQHLKDAWLAHRNEDLESADCGFLAL